MRYNIIMITMYYSDFIPNVFPISDSFRDEIRDARKFVLEQVLETSLTEIEKQKIIERINGVKYFVNNESEDSFAGLYDSDGSYSNKGENAIFLSQNIGDKHFVTLVHEMFHAASSTFKKYGFMGQADETKTKFNNRGITEAATAMFSNLALGEVDAYYFPAYVLKVLCLKLGKEKTLAYYLKGDLEGLKTAISNKYGHKNTEIVDEIFECFNAFSDLTKREERKTVFVNQQKCVQGVAGKVLELYGKLITPTLIKNGEVNPFLAYDVALEDLNFDSVLNNYFRFAKDAEGEKIRIFEEENLKQEQKIELKKQKGKGKLGEHAGLYEILNERTDAKKQAQDQIIKYFTDALGAENVNYHVQINQHVAPDDALVRSALFVANAPEQQRDVQFE